MSNYAHLLIFAEQVDDLEKLRIAAQNRTRALVQDHGMEGTPEHKQLAETAEALHQMEQAAIKQLQKAVRKHPLGDWVKATVGVGEKQAGRLLGAIGDPAERSNPAKLWQYAGHGDPGRSRRVKGEQCSYNPKAKMRVYLIAESCIKHARSPYRPVYDRERAKWADRDTSDAHKHAHALRVVGKEMLKDMWVEARRVA